MIVKNEPVNDRMEKVMRARTNNKEEHVTTVLSSGSGMMEKKTPICSCGWNGIGYEAHNDWQFTLVNDQIKQHKKESSES